MIWFTTRSDLLVLYEANLDGLVAALLFFFYIVINVSQKLKRVT